MLSGALGQPPVCPLTGSLVTATADSGSVIVSRKELDQLRADAARLATIRNAVERVQAKLDSRKCNKWDCLSTAMHVIDVASLETTGSYLR